jgi:hypothetical protein
LKNLFIINNSFLISFIKFIDGKSAKPNRGRKKGSIVIKSKKRAQKKTKKNEELNENDDGDYEVSTKFYDNFANFQFLKFQSRLKRLLIIRKKKAKHSILSNGKDTQQSQTVGLLLQT